MEHIREALLKADPSLGAVKKEGAARSPAAIAPEHKNEAASVPLAQPAWKPRQVELESHHLEANRIVSAAMDDPAHVSFNILRTRVQKLQRDRNWKNFVVTSPTQGCGKTMVAVNLAFSMARNPNCRTVLVDLDLRKPSVAKTLGIASSGSIGQFLQGEGRAESCFVQINPNLIVGLNVDRTRQSSELVQSSRMGELLRFVVDSFAPDVVLYDLPPMRSSDDALAFLPKIDAALLVVASGTTTVSELDECEHQLSHLDKLLGIVINKSARDTRDYYY
ncbi:CpsD/CapB family tyrosine-protein kinase [Mesorhizobium koreense]|jgi:Mrp family chromosome partitioning ATPase|uniref:CpsD/CapB family tyrosine-protein kinase n=1 Tax=Mesorhizobium koreense TaxID=3074855 RepID=UPI00287B8A17|nr:CpsD/CapB family tyrosine-protein kinase [Mesorhizobium sp. WR6]